MRHKIHESSVFTYATIGSRSAARRGDSPGDILADLGLGRYRPLETGDIRASVALEEALNNALYHGNLELDSHFRDGDRATYRVMLEERRHADPYRNRKIHVSVQIESDHATIVIRDEGPGFDPSQLPDPTAPANLQKLSGRGLLLMRTFMDEVKYNERGNQLTLIKRRNSN